jgi:hypothetical protein
MVIVQTLSVNGRNLWKDGCLLSDAFKETDHCLDMRAELELLIANPSWSIGLAE